MPSKHQLQVLPLTLCVLFCQHLWLRWMLILERYSSSPLLLLSQWRWGVAGAAVTPGWAFSRQLRGTGLCWAGTEQKELYAQGLGNSSSRIHLDCRRSLISWPACLRGWRKDLGAWLAALAG